MTAGADPVGGQPTGPSGTDAGTRLLCVIGHPVAHTLSPRLHSAAIAATGLNAVYLAFDVTPERFPHVVEGLHATTGPQRGFLGANVTIPHKAAALALAHDATEEARFIGAANTLFLDDDDRLIADNTDAAGLIGVLRGPCGIVAGDQALILGAGGAARAAAVALGRIGAAVQVRSRRPDAAADVRDLALRAGAEAGGGEARIVLNATPLGRHGERLPEDLMQQGRGQVALDLGYGQPTPFLETARDRGAVAEDGLSMLIGQAEAAFERWTGRRPPPGVMSDSVAQVPTVACR